MPTLTRPLAGLRWGFGTG